MLTAYPQHCNCVYSMRLAVPLLHHFCFIQWVRATEVMIHCTWLRSWKSVKCFYLLFSATSVCLVLSNLPSLKEVIRSNMQYKNTICSHCQPRDETNLLSIYSGKVIGTVEFHKGLGILIDDCLLSGAYIQYFVGKLEQDLRFYFKDYSSFSLATKNRKTVATFNWLQWCFTSRSEPRALEHHSPYITDKLSHSILSAVVSFSPPVQWQVVLWDCHCGPAHLLFVTWRTDYSMFWK